MWAMNSSFLRLVSLSIITRSYDLTCLRYLIDFDRCTKLTIRTLMSVIICSMLFNHDEEWAESSIEMTVNTPLRTDGRRHIDVLDLSFLLEKFTCQNHRWMRFSYLLTYSKRLSNSSLVILSFEFYSQINEIHHCHYISLINFVILLLLFTSVKY